jgi:hypothetical protein
LALGAALALAGCGGVEFQGKVFDYVGLSGDRQEPDVKMAERPPLVLPPDTKALPQPGSGAAVATARQDWPKNPEIVRQETIDAQQAAKQKEAAEQDPINPYAGKPTLLDKLLRKKKKVEQVDDTPEPDPNDKQSDEQQQTAAKGNPKPLTPHQPQELPAPGPDPFHPAAPDSYKNPEALY